MYMNMIVETECPECGHSFNYDLECEFEDGCQDVSETLTCPKCQSIFEEETEICMSVDTSLKSQKVIEVKGKPKEKEFVDKHSGNLFADRE